MKLYVIGNGFDKAHNLGTSYYDFYNYIKENSSKHKDWDLIIDYYPEGHELWSDAEQYVCKIDPVLFLKLKRSLPYTFLDLLYDKLHEAFDNFIMKVENDIGSKDRIFEFENNAIFISFNYTSTLESLYNIPENLIIYPHNSMKDISMKILFGLPVEGSILGHSPYADKYFYYTDFAIGSDKDYIEFRNKTTKNTNKYIEQTQMKKKLLCTQSQISEVVYYGFSFSEADKDYVNLISQCLPYTKKFVVYYHNNGKTTNEESINTIKEKMVNIAEDPSKYTFINCDGIVRI